MDCNNLKEKLSELDTLFNSEDLVLSEKQSKALVVDLGNETFSVFDIPQVWSWEYSGGAGLGARLWAEFAGLNAEDPSSYQADNPVVLTSPTEWGNNLCITFLSPQNNRLVFNDCQNAFGPKLRACGYAAVVLTGRMRRLGAVDISKEKTGFNYSEKMAGLGTLEAASLFKTTCLTIGPAGENSVLFATCVCDGQITGRGGLGYVLGKKNLKAVCVLSDAMKNNDTLADLYIENSKTGKKLKRTSSNILINNAMRVGWAPVENFKYRTDPRLFHLTGDETLRRLGDLGVRSGIGYASTLMLGSNAGCFDIEKVCERFKLCIELGLDPVSTGCILGWAYEVSGENNTAFLDNAFVLNLIENMAKGTASGEKLIQSFKASKSGYSVNGLECGPFDFRGSFAQALNSSLGNLFPVYPAFFANLCSYDIAGWTLFNENAVLGLCSLGIAPELLLCMCGELSPVTRFVLRFVPFLKKYLIRTEKVFKDTILTSDYVWSLGNRCRMLIMDINSCLNSQFKPSIPDYFIVNPQSNCKTQAVVPIHKLLENYRHDSEIMNLVPFKRKNHK